MAIFYGALRGKPDRYKREDNASSPHLQIRVLDASGQPWRIAVNVPSRMSAMGAIRTCASNRLRWPPTSV